MAAHSRPPRGEIITFYSYKGGTGRTMAMANVACVLAEKLRERERVLVVDWDLEAPGLHRFFPGRGASLASDGGLDATPGLMEVLTTLRDRLPTAPAKSPEDAAGVTAALFSSLDVNAFTSDSGVPGVRIMRAGANDRDQYSRQVNTFDWEGLFTRAPTVYRELAEWLAKHFRYVLVDSRTGVTDISGICTSLLPEKLVVVFTPNKQSLTGVRELVERATSYRRNSDDLRPLLVFPLPSRIEASLQDLRARWRLGDRDQGIVGYQPMFEELFARVYAVPRCDLSQYFDEVQIQQTPDYAYGEEIAVRRSADRFSLEKSYRVFVDRLTSGAPAWAAEPVVPPVVATPGPAPEPEAPRPIPTPVRNEVQDAHNSKVFLSHAAADRDRIRAIEEFLESAGMQVWSAKRILPGEASDEAVTKALDAADVVVVFWSRMSVSSDFVRVEANEGLRRGILVPVLLDDSVPPLAFRAFQSIDLSRHSARGSERLLEAIQRTALGSPVTLAAPSAAPRAAPPHWRFNLRLLAAAATILVTLVAGFTWRSFSRSESPPVVPSDSGNITSPSPGLPSPIAPPPVSPDSPAQVPTFVGVRVPNLVGSQSSDAMNTSKALGIRLILTDESGKVYESLDGVVTSQTPKAGETVREGIPISLSIATALATTPTVVGMNLTRALEALLRAQLRLGSTQSRYVIDAKEGTILDQSPAAGTRVPAGSSVNVIVATQTSGLLELSSSFESGVRAYELGQYATAQRHLQEAIDRQAGAKSLPKTVRYGLRSVPYAPHSYLAATLFDMKAECSLIAQSLRRSNGEPLVPDIQSKLRAAIQRCVPER